jgi:hypothetical protein
MHPSGLRCVVGGRILSNRDAIRRRLRFALISLRQNDFVNVVDEKVQELVGVLLHIIIELFLLFSQSGDEFLWRYRSDPLLLRCNRIKPKSSHKLNFRFYRSR